MAEKPRKDKRGGRRPGAGRPKDAKQKDSQAVEKARETITELNELARGGLMHLASNFMPLVEAEMEVALDPDASSRMRMDARHFLMTLFSKTIQVKDNPAETPLAQIIAETVIVQK